MKLALKICIVLVLLLVFTGNSKGQDKVKIIQIIDSASSAVLPFANMFLTKSGIGTSSDLNGFAKLKITSNIQDTLVLSYIGYVSKRVPTSAIRDSVKIRLSSSLNILSEVVIKYVEPMKAKDVVKKTIKNTNLNYSNNDEVLKGIFRETVQENGQFIQLNEAIVKVFYTSYPQKKLDRKIWEKWYYDDSYSFDFDADKYFFPLLQDFNTSRDKMMVLASRSSLNWSKYNIESALIGGPLMLTGLDKIKYQYDFLNPKLLNEYKYTNGGIVAINGQNCHSIKFSPKSRRSRNFSVDLGRKTKDAIYNGIMYIDTKSFAVVKIEYQLAVDRDFGFFSGGVPLEYLVEINYKINGNKWALSYIKTKDTRKVGKDEKGSSILHTGIKEFLISNIDTNEIFSFPDSICFKSTRFSSIRYFKKYYNPNFELADSTYTESIIDNQIKNDLEKDIPLSTQYEDFNNFSNNYNAPLIEKKDYTFFYHNTTFHDSLHWITLPKNDYQLRHYLIKENLYSKKVCSSNKQIQRKLFFELNNFYPADSSSQRVKISNSLYIQHDSLNDLILYRSIDSLSGSYLLNLSEIESQHHRSSINKLIPNKSENNLIIQFEKADNLNDFVKIISLDSKLEYDSIFDIHQISWLTDSQLLYVKANSIGQSDELIHFSQVSGKSTVLYHEKDSTFDVNIGTQKNQTFCKVESKSENEIYQILLSNSKLPSLNLIQKRKKDVFYEIVYDKVWYKVTNEKSGTRDLFYSDVSSPFDWKKVNFNKKIGFIYEFKTTKNHLVFNVIENSIHKIKYCRKNSDLCEVITIDSTMGSIELKNTDWDENKINYTISSPSVPFHFLKYEITNSKRELILNVKTKDSNITKGIKTNRIWAKGLDGVDIPMTIMLNEQTKKQKGLILKVYGAYGANTIPFFSAEDAILLKSGYTIVYAHVRGDIVLGYDWYNEGKVLHKNNSFQDYISCAKYLISNKYTDSNMLVAYGNSAGGLVVGWAINNYPELFNTAILDHPFIDAVNTMMNDSLPLTIDEYKEWGNPNDKTVFDYMSNYSPYQNIVKQDYPNLIVIGGYLDQQTPIGQIAKYVASIRQNSTNSKDIVFITDMESGHKGNVTGKEWIKTFARVYSLVGSNLDK